MIRQFPYDIRGAMFLVDNMLTTIARQLDPQILNFREVVTYNLSDGSFFQVRTVPDEKKPVIRNGYVVGYPDSGWTDIDAPGRDVDFKLSRFDVLPFQIHIVKAT